MLPAGQPFFLFRDNFTILFHNPLKILNLNRQSKVLRGKKELTSPPKIYNT